MSPQPPQILNLAGAAIEAKRVPRKSKAKHRESPTPRQTERAASRQPKRSRTAATNGSYEFTYGGNSNSTHQRRERGYMKKAADGRQVRVIEGFYSYVAPNGEVVKMRYIADEFGYRAFRDKS